MSDETMLQEAIIAARAGGKERARNLLTRLLKNDKNNPDYWFWMSGVVETQREQIFCLENLLRVQPANVFARRGLIMMGALPPDKNLPIPPATRAKMWQVESLEQNKPKLFEGVSFARLIGLLLTFAVLIGMVVGGFYFLGQFYTRPQALPTPNFLLTATFVQYVTFTPEPTGTPTATPDISQITPTQAKPTPLHLLLSATYTPTPVYVNTPHPETEAYRSAVFAREQGDWESAARFLLQAISLIPDAPDLYYALGEAYLQLGQYPDAFLAFQNSLGIDSRFGPSHLGLALARLGTNPQADVSRDFENAMTFSPDFGLVYLERARYLIDNNQLEGALRDLEQAVVYYPESPLVLFLRARIALAQGDYSMARDEAARAIESDITLLDAYLTLAQAHLALGELEAGILRLETYTVYVPDNIETQRLLAKSYSDVGRYNQALFILDELIASNELDAEAFYLRGEAYLGRENGDIALKDFNAANRLRRGVFQYNLGIGMALYAVNSYRDAYRQFNEAFSLARTNAQTAEVLYYRALALYALDEIPAAIADLRNLLALPQGEIPNDLRSKGQELLDEVNQNAPAPTPAAP